MLKGDADCTDRGCMSSNETRHNWHALLTPSPETLRAIDTSPETWPRHLVCFCALPSVFFLRAEWLLLGTALFQKDRL